jgi:Icc protein
VSHVQRARREFCIMNELQPLQQTMADSADPIRILHLTDTHLHATAASRMRGVTTYRTLMGVLAAVRQHPLWPPEAVIVTGDIVQDESAAGYERFREALLPLHVPIYCVPGNHDDPALMQQALSQAPFQVGGQARLGTWTLPLLSTFSPGDDGGRLGTEGLAQLSTCLESDRGRHILICMHHHPLPMGSAWLDGVALRDADEFLALVRASPDVRGVLWGHVHQASDRLEHGIRFMSTPSTCAQFLPRSSHFALDELPPAARWLTLGDDGRIDTEIQWVESAV